MLIRIFTRTLIYVYLSWSVACPLRSVVYKQGVRIAMFARYPLLFAPGSTIAAPVQNLDIAPTFLELVVGIVGYDEER